MSKRSIVLVVMVVLVVLVLAAPGYGAAKKKHQCTITFRAVAVERDEGFGNVGTSEVYVGMDESKCDGGKTKHGVGETRNTIAGTGPIQLKAEATHYFEAGTLKWSALAPVTAQPDGSFALAGEFKVTGGTGVFKGATGSGTLSGVVPAGASSGTGLATLVTVEYKGTITY